MEQAQFISLTTDFGTRDGFVGAMKGVILSINPRVSILDISHDIPRQDIFAGAMVLCNTCPYFPRGTIHVAVVDPGVGTDRKAMVAVTNMGFLVLPDNGLITLLHGKTPVLAAYAVTNRDICLPLPSATFHGRDIFAPVAAHLSRGLPPEEVGPKMETFHTLTVPRPKRTQYGIQGEIIYVDVYGNLFTNIESEMLDNFGKDCVLSCAQTKIQGLSRTYGDKSPGELLFLPGSSGFVEIALNGGNAFRQLGLKPGDGVFLTS